MTTVTPPTVPPLSPPAAAGPATATVPQPPAALLQLSIGARLDASLLVADAAKGQLVLQTPVGQLTVAMTTPPALPLPKDAKLALQVLALTPQVQLAVIGPLAERSPPAAAPRAASATAAPAGPATIALTVGATTTVTLLRPMASIPDAGRVLPPGISAAKPGGSAVSSSGGGAVTPSTAPKAAGPTAPSGQAPPQVAPVLLRSAGPLPPATATAPAAEGRVPMLPAGTQFSARIVAVQPSTVPAGMPATVAAGAALGPTVVGTVTQSAANHAIVQTPAGPIALAQPGNQPLPAGTQVTLAFLGPPSIPDVSPAYSPSSLRTDRWPALEEALRTVRDAAPAVHQHLMNSAVPRAENGLAAGIVQFLAALKGGEAGSWLGETTIRLLQRVRPEVAQRLDDDFRSRARLASEPDGGDWRVAVIPVSVQQEITQLRLLTRRPRDNQDAKDGENARFVVDVSLSRIGRLQLDGLVRRNDKRLDLIVRTERPLPGTIRDDIRRLFSDALEVTGINGSVGFQAQPSGFVEFSDALPEQPSGMIV